MSYFRFSVGLWGRVDSNHWTPKRTDLQSVAIATMRLPHFRLPNWRELEPMKGLEPPTGWLQISYSTNWVTSAFSACQTTLFLVNWGCKDTTFSQTHQNFFQLFSNIFHKQLIHISILRKKNPTYAPTPARKIPSQDTNLPKFRSYPLKKNITSQYPIDNKHIRTNTPKPAHQLYHS